MKRILCAAVALVLCLSLCACGSKGPSGAYSDESGMITFTFEDGKITAEAYGEVVATGTFTVSSDTVDLEFTGKYADYLNGMSGLTYDAKANTLTDGAGTVLYKD